MMMGFMEGHGVPCPSMKINTGESRIMTIKKQQQQNNRTASIALGESCGVCGGWGEGLHLAYLCCFALSALQHRGQESAGIAVGDGAGGPLWHCRGMGLVSEVFPDPGVLKSESPPGPVAVGHVRYSYEQEGRRPENTQPLVLKYGGGELAVGHNGRLLNGTELREELEEAGAIFQTATDSELLAHLVARQGPVDLEEALAAAVSRLRGAFAFILTNGRRLVALRDGFGFRPLVLGTLGEKGIFAASETCALDTIGARFLREVRPGEMVTVDASGLRSRRLLPACPPALCIFEFVYFARPDSLLEGRSVHRVRRELGRRLAREQPAAADLVSGVPDSSIPAASGYAEAAGIPYELALVKNRYIGRTFLEPTPEMRAMGVDLKLNAVQPVVAGKRVVLVDDSLIKGTTSRKLVEVMRRAGAREVHLRVSSPPVIGSCRYGIDTPGPEGLAAWGRTPGELARELGADSVGFLSLEGTVQSVGLTNGGLCLACFTGKYPQ